MNRLWIAPFLASVLPLSLASPVNYDISPTGSACLAVFITLFVVLSLLFTFKHIYRTNRRIRFSKACSKTYASRCYAGTADWSSTSLLKAKTSDTPISAWKDDTRRGFLVGLFGSPSWEARVVSSKKTDTSSFRLHQEPRRQWPSVNEKCSIIDVSEPNSLNTVVNSRALYRLGNKSSSPNSRSINFPSFPPLAKISCPISQLSRRLSVPSVSVQQESKTTSKRINRHSSFRSWKSWGSDGCSKADGSLRLVKPSRCAELPLPFSPRLFQRMSGDDNSPSPNLTDELPLAPALATLDPSLRFLPGANSAVHISHPYALGSPKRRSVTTPVVTSGHDFASSGANLECAPPSSQIENASKSQSLPVSSKARTSWLARQPFDSIATVITTVPTNTRDVSPSSTPPLSSFPLPPASAVIGESQTGRRKVLTQPLPLQPIHQSSTRSRRSLALGPSPLRNMSLPANEFGELSMSDLKAIQTFLDKENESVAVTIVSPATTQSHNPYGIGLGHPERPPFNNHRSSVSTWRSSKGNEDPNLLLGIIRELVEETSEWDPSLFMSKNFKTMLQNAEVEPRTGDDAGCPLGSFAATPIQCDYDKPHVERPPSSPKQTMTSRLGGGILQNGNSEANRSLSNRSTQSARPATLRTPSTQSRRTSTKSNGSTRLISFWDDGSTTEDKRFVGAGLT
ncbi:hypothetical protein FISHEDRAFT_72565 [Fistulina hepatica ATCC 64428]|nr:hypothetical protein FISHEDRAFT_72565 [Fistulina hepatica ATCC 64428]